MVRGKEKQDNSNKHIDEGISLRHSRSSREDVSHKSKRKHNRNESRIPFFSSRSFSKDSANRKPSTDGSVRAPYMTSNKSRNKEEQNHQNIDNGSVVTKSRPRSVITKLFKQSQSTVISTSEQETNVKEPLSAKGPGEVKHGLRRGHKEKEGKMTEGVSINYNRNELPTAATSSVINSNNGQTVSQDLPLPPWRRRYLFPESQPTALLKEANEIIMSLS